MTVDHAAFAQKKAKCSMTVWGFAYLFLFPFLFVFFAPFVGVNSIHSSFTDKFLGFIDLFPIFAMPLSLFLMWLSYSKAYYKIVRLCQIIPILFFALALLVHVILAPM